MCKIKLYTFQQKFNEVKSLDISETTQTEVKDKINWRNIQEGSRLGIVVGSRGISNINIIVKNTVDVVKKMGHQPIIIPAMGSHGGGTAEGQIAVLTSLGITEELMGCHIESTVTTKIINYIDDIPVHIDTTALTCQGLILINRIKAHTSFTGKIESGLLKMAVIGLGNPEGAALIHSFGPRGLQELIPKIGNYIIDNIPIILGIALIEDANKNLCLINGLKPDEIYTEEQNLLLKAKANMAKLPVDNLDILIIEEMGKCFSGTGIDTNIIGRLRLRDIPEPQFPDIKRIIINDLSDRSYGNATGVGLADFVTKSLVDKINWEVTYQNVITTTFTQRGMLPIVMENENAALKAAIKSLGNIKLDNLRIIKIKNTLDLKVIKVTKNLFEEIKSQGDIIYSESQEVLDV